MVLATVAAATRRRACILLLLAAAASAAATNGAAAFASPSLHDVLLDDAFIPSSSRCGAAAGGNTTTISFSFTPSAEETSKWSAVNQKWEGSVFLAEMRHDDASGRNRTWAARFGTGGNIYSLVGPYGEAIPPQTPAAAPFVDEVLQCVAVDQNKNIPSEGHSYFIHQAGAYLRDEGHMPPPFFSPNVAKSCDGNACRFASWGTQAHVPTVFKSDLLYIHRYRDCGDGVLEYTQGFQNVGDVDTGDVLTYLNVPWGGVRTSSLPEFVLSGPGGRMLDKEMPLHRFGATDATIPNLNTMGGFTTFATDLPIPNGKAKVTLPCFRFGDDGTTAEVKDPCAKSDVKRSGYTRFVLVLDGPNPCRYFPPHSDKWGGYYVACRIRGGDTIPRIDGCRQACGEDGLRFTSIESGESIVVTSVVHWSFGNGFAYFSSPNATAEDINAKFGNSDSGIRVTYDDSSGRKEENSLALAYVHGVDREFEDAGNDWLQMPGRARFGRAGRDFTVFTINARIKLEPGNTYFNRQYLVTDTFSNMEDHANEWVNETVADVLTGSDFEGRRVEMWEDDDAGPTIGVAFAPERGGTSTTCARGRRSECVGSSVHGPGTTPFFSITCGDRSYVGPDRYALAPARNSTADPIRSYVCDGEEDDPTARPTWTLLGYFPARGDGCGGAIGVKLDPAFCELSTVEQDETKREESKREGGDTSQPTSQPTVRGEGRNIFDHSDKIPSLSPSPSPSCVSRESVPTTDSVLLDVKCQTVDDTRNETISFAFILGRIRASNIFSGGLNEGVNNTMVTDVLAALENVFISVFLDESNITTSYANKSAVEASVKGTTLSNGTESDNAVHDKRVAAANRRHLLVYYRGEPVIMGISDHACPEEAKKRLLCHRIVVSIKVTVADENVLTAVDRIQVAFTEFVNNGELLVAIEAVNSQTGIKFATAVALPTASPMPRSRPTTAPSSMPSIAPSFSTSSIPSEGPSNQPSSLPSKGPSNQPSLLPSEEPGSESSTISTISPATFSGVLSSSAPETIKMSGLALLYSASYFVLVMSFLT